MSSATPPRALSKESPAPALSKESPVPALSKESPVPALSQWLQLMLAEIQAKREAQEQARAEEARRRAELAAPTRDDSTGGAARS